MNLGQAVEDVVLGEPTGTVCGPRHLAALRTSEAAQGAGPQNGDGDTLDLVLHSVGSDGSVLNLMTAASLSGQGERLVTFLVDEGSQGSDFNFDAR